jgi:glutamate-1-semialdehyde 2,1-aminomutase
MYQRLCEVIPGGVNSPVRAFKAMEMAPLVAERGMADLIYDVDGHAYIDYCGSWGALIHGHAHPDILDAAYQQMVKGTTFGITSEIEGKLAQKIVEHVSSVEKVRFVSSGTEATMSAVRLARGVTGRQLVVKFTGNYHGHSDGFLVQAGSGVLGLSSTSSSAGVPAESVRHTVSLPYNSVEQCREFLLDPLYREDIAAVILEPIACNMGVVPPSLEFLQMLRSITQEIGALLIFDEVITGFRVALGGAQALYNIQADLTCFGKIIGGGFPAAAFGGRRDVMDALAPLGKVYQAGTLSGNPVAMAAGLRALEMLEVDGIYEELARKTKIITQPVRELLERKGVNACVHQEGSLFTIFFGRKSVSNMDEALALDKQEFTRFFKHLFNKGVYAPPLQQEAWFVSTAHNEEHLERTRDVVMDYFLNYYK